MGACNSGGNKDTEVDMYMQKHHKRSTIVTDKNNYEISKQQFSAMSINIKSK